jgi:hypothetical protein
MVQFTVSRKGKYTVAMPTFILITNVFKKLIPNYAMIKIPNTSPSNQIYTKNTPKKKHD